MSLTRAAAVSPSSPKPHPQAHSKGHLPENHFPPRRSPSLPNSGLPIVHKTKSKALCPVKRTFHNLSLSLSYFQDHSLLSFCSLSSSYTGVFSFPFCNWLFYLFTFQELSPSQSLLHKPSTSLPFASKRVLLHPHNPPLPHCSSFPYPGGIKPP